MKVVVGQTWVHVRSGDVRVVHAVVPYEQRVGIPPRIEDCARIAVMTPNPCDRRDSSDMELDEDDHPRFPASWRHVTSWPEVPSILESARAGTS